MIIDIECPFCNGAGRVHATWTNCRELDRVCRAMFGKDFDNAQRIAWEF